MSFDTKPPKKSQVQDIDFSDRLKRQKRAVEAVDPNGQMEWKPNRRSDIFELRTIRYKQRYPQDVIKYIKKIHRVAIPKAGLFELDEKGTMDTQHRVKEALVYTLNESVDNLNIEEGPVGYTTNIGWYEVPTIRYQKHDEFGNGLAPITTGMRNVFYLSFSPEAVDRVLEEAGNNDIKMGVSVANELGDRWGEDWSVHNLEEFKNVQDIYMLIEASKHGYLTKEEGGYKDFVEARGRARQELKPIKRKKNLRGEIIAE